MLFSGVFLFLRHRDDYSSIVNEVATQRDLVYGIIIRLLPRCKYASTIKGWID